MKIVPWFYDPRLDDDLARAHRTAYVKSLKDSHHAVKAQAGTYYYRGYAISNEGSRECPWSYGKPDDYYDDKEWAETKKQAMENVDELENGSGLCNILF